jgi:amidase
MIAPRKGELDNMKKCRDYYGRTMNITSFSGIACLPEITLPVGKIQNVPFGLSLASAHHEDEFLLAAVKQLFKDQF